VHDSPVPNAIMGNRPRLAADEIVRESEDFRFVGTDVDWAASLSRFVRIIEQQPRPAAASHFRSPLSADYTARNNPTVPVADGARIRRRRNPYLGGRFGLRAKKPRPLGTACRKNPQWQMVRQRPDQPAKPFFPLWAAFRNPTPFFSELGRRPSIQRTLRSGPLPIYAEPRPNVTAQRRKSAQGGDLGCGRNRPDAHKPTNLLSGHGLTRIAVPGCPFDAQRFLFNPPLITSSPGTSEKRRDSRLSNVPPHLSERACSGRSFRRASPAPTFCPSAQHVDGGRPSAKLPPPMRWGM